jgi:UDP-galactose transporter B1
MALVFSQCVVNYIYAVIVSRGVLTQGEDTTKTSYYVICSLSYLVAMVSSNKALLWVNYPTQVVGKSCKPIPVMILGVLIGRKVYPKRKYLFVLMIVIGVALFMYKDKAAKAASDSGIGLGEILLLVSLACDGVTGAIQERMKSEHNTRSGHMMQAMNLWSMLFLGVALVITGEGLEFIGFMSRHPGVIWQVLSFCVASAFGQFFIFMCVSDFGPLPCSIITTTRKFFTVLASVIFFGNELISRQWMGVALVFAGLFLDGAFGRKKQVEKQINKTSSDKKV